MLKPKFLRRIILLSAFTLVASTKTMVAVDAQAQSHMRSLSAEDARSDRLEERFLDTFVARVALQLKKWSPSLHLRLASDKEKVINEFFEELNVKSAKRNFFASERYQTWARRVLGAYEDSAEAYKALFHELKKHFSDYELATFVLGGLASQKTRTVASRYHNLQKEDWIKNKGALNVFRALQLDVDKGNVFENPLLETYVSFARQLPRKDASDEQIIYDELFSMLEQEFGVARLAEMLGDANVDLREDKVGGGMMNALFRNVASKGPNHSLGDVKKVFNENAVVDFSAVIVRLSYAKRSLPPNEFERLVENMVNDLWAQRGVKDKALATVITAAQEDESTRVFATKALEKLFTYWKEEKKTASDVLNILGFELARMKAEDIVESPLLLTWLAFESRSHASDAKLLVALHNQMSDEQIASMLVITTRDPNMKYRLLRVRETLSKIWQTEALDEYGVFQRLRLNEAGDKLFTHPALHVWLWYVHEHHGANSNIIIPQVVRSYYRNSKSLREMVRRELKKEDYSSAIGVAEMLV